MSGEGGILDLRARLAAVEPLAAAAVDAPGVYALVASRRYDHAQTSPAMTWTVNHNLGASVSVTVLSVGGMEVEAEVVNVSQNQVQILFVTPTAGSAVIT